MVLAVVLLEPTQLYAVDCPHGKHYPFPPDMGSGRCDHSPVIIIDPFLFGLTMPEDVGPDDWVDTPSTISTVWWRIYPHLQGRRSLLTEIRPIRTGLHVHRGGPPRVILQVPRVMTFLFAGLASVT